MESMIGNSLKAFAKNIAVVEQKDDLFIIY
jgi:hypothetical protein